MKLIRFGNFRQENPAVELEDGTRKDCSAHFNDWNHDFFVGNGLAKLEQLIASEAAALPDVPANARLGSPVARPGKVLCIGLNYSDHAAETGMNLPPEPILFMKGTNTVVGPYDNIVIPRGSEKTDWEVELGVILGKDASYLSSAEEANDYIAGYCISNDVSERAFQLEHAGQWTKGKSCDTFNPIGPYLVTKDAVADACNLSMTLDVNGQRMQDGNTKTMAFDPCFVIHYLSQFMTLEAGDLITTGTPPGVGMGMKPPRFLKSGDVVELEITGLGTQRQVCCNVGEST
ncbi:MAG: fumarylacetoacetate hydrolase family protein [Planctomycetes bacterium]|nr:fumarylacetoacetate hydrolase family protein [Planctomycetota bacterium]